METDHIPIDPIACIIGLLLVGLFLLFKKYFRTEKEPYLFFSYTDPFEKISSFRTKYAELPRFLGYFSIGFFLLAFTDPHYFAQKSSGETEHSEKIYPTEGIALYFILDRSGSMREEVPMEGGTLSKLDLMKKVTREFISGRPDDLIGIISFARGATVVSPLTLDHEVLLKRLAEIGFTKDKDQDGTAMGYAIYKTANLIAATKHFAESLPPNQKPAYEIKSSVMILITDGFPDPNPLDKGKRLRNLDADEAARFAKENGIRLYIINVDPRFSSQEFDPQRHLLERSAEMTGGKFFLADSSYSLRQIFSDIDQMEKSILPASQEGGEAKVSVRISFYPYLFAIGLVCLLLSLALNGTLFRRVP